MTATHCCLLVWQRWRGKCLIVLAVVCLRWTTAPRQRLFGTTDWLCHHLLAVSMTAAGRTIDCILPLFACDCILSLFVYEMGMVGQTNDFILPLLSGSGWQVKERGGGEG
jgi:hypothetical protein